MQENEIIELMNKRGYTLMSHGATKKVYFFADAYTGVNAEVRVKESGEEVQLSYSKLKMFCTIQTPFIDLTHPNFSKFERVLAFYVNLIKDSNPLENEEIKNG